MTKINIISIVLIMAIAGGCVIVKHEEEQPPPPVLEFSPTPEMEMSDVMVRSDDGDMVAFLPKDWFLVNLEGDSPVDVIAVATNKEYTIALIFSKIRKSKKNDEIVAREGLLGLARIALDRRSDKTAGAVRLAGKYSEISMGPRKFAKYEFTNSDLGLRGISAVLISSLDNFYEVSVIPMNLTGIVPVTQYDLDRVFSSVLATVQY
jgi:hypothetical protein